MKKKLLALLLAVSMVAGLAACSGGGADESAATTEDASGETAEEGVEVLNEREEDVFVEDEQGGERDSAVIPMSIHQNQAR